MPLSQGQLRSQSVSCEPRTSRVAAGCSRANDAVYNVGTRIVTKGRHTMPRRFSLDRRIGRSGKPRRRRARRSTKNPALPIIHLDSPAQGGECPDVSCTAITAGSWRAGWSKPAGGPLSNFRSAPPVPDKTQLVYKQQGKHCGFPNLLLLNSGDLFVHFRLGRHSCRRERGDRPGPLDGWRKNVWSDARGLPRIPNSISASTSSAFNCPTAASSCRSIRTWPAPHASQRHPGP